MVGVTLQLYDHGAATHRKGACCAGQDIHDARAVAERIGIPHYVLDYESRFKEAVIDRFAESYVARRDAGALRRLQHGDQVPRSARSPRASSAPRCWRPAITSPRARCPAAAARSIARARKSATRAISCSAPRASSSTCCAFRSATRSKAETRELARQFGLAVADKHDSQDICFVPTGRYADVIERLKPGAAEAGEIVDLDGQVLGRAFRHHPFHRRPAPRPGHRDRRAALCGAARCRSAAASWSARARRCARSRIVLRDVNWIGEGTHRRGARRRPARSVRQGALDAAAAAGWLRPRRRRLRGRTGRRRGRRFARPGLRVLRRRRRARRACSAAASSRARSRRPTARADADERIGRCARRRADKTCAHGGGPRQARRRAGLCALGAGLRPACSARCSSAAGAPRSRRPNGIGGRILEVGVGTGISLPDYARSNRLVGVDHFRADAAQGAGARRRAQAEQCRGAGGDGRRASGACRTQSFDVVVAQYVITAVPRSGSDARRVRARAQAGRRDRAGQSYRRRDRACAALFEQWLRAGGAPARLAAGISASARLADWAAAPRRRARDRAPRRCRRSGISR